MIRIGIICPSEIAYRRFLPALKKANGFAYIGVAVADKQEFVGASDEVIARERNKAQPFVDNFGGKIFDGYEALIKSDEVDAIYVPLPPALHFKWAKSALDYGKHVLVEKPATTCYADTQNLVSLAAEKGLALHENYMFVFHDQLSLIDKIVKSGEIGDVRLYRISFGFPRRGVGDFRYSRALGGGALLDAGGYTLKLGTELLGRDVRLKAAKANYLDDFNVDMYGSATLENNNGEVAQVSFGMDNDYKCELEIWGSKGTLVAGRILTAPDGYEPNYTIKKNQEITTGKMPSDDSFLKSIKHFSNCIFDGKERKENYEKMLLQAELVEAFKELGGFND